MFDNVNINNIENNTTNVNSIYISRNKKIHFEKTSPHPQLMG